MRKTTKKIASLVMAGALVVTSAPVQSEAATATVKLNKTSATVTVGKTVKLKVSKKNVSSKNKVTSIKKTTWSSKKSSIASVSGGTVTGKKAGSTTIKCKVKYVLKKNGKSTTKTKTLSCTVKVNAKKVTPTTAPASQAPVSQAPASQTPASQAPTSQAPASGAPASEVPASGTPASQAPASGAPAASASAAPSASASAAPSASASAAPSATPAASASAAPSIVPATAAPENNGPTATPKALVADYTGIEFAFSATESGNLATDGKTATSIKLKGLAVVSETVEVRISKVGDTAMNASAGENYAWRDAESGGTALFTGLTKSTKYTFEARVKKDDTDGNSVGKEHKAGKISTTEITTAAEELSVSGTLTWRNGQEVVSGGSGFPAGTAISDTQIDTSNLTCTYNGSTVPSVTFKTQEDLNKLTKNTSVKLEVVSGSGTSAKYGEVSVVVLVKHDVSNVNVAAKTTRSGWVTIAAPETLPAGLQYTVVAANNADTTNATWTDITDKTFSNALSTNGRFLAGTFLALRIKDSTTPAAHAENGWTGSGTGVKYVQLTKENLDVDGYEVDTMMGSAVMDTPNFKIEAEKVTLKTAGGDNFTVKGDLTLNKNLDIESSAVLTINGGLTIPTGKTIADAGTIVNNGTITNSGTIEGSGELNNAGTINTEDGTIDSAVVLKKGTKTIPQMTTVHAGYTSYYTGGTLPTVTLASITNSGTKTTYEYNVTGSTLKYLADNASEWANQGFASAAAANHYHWGFWIDFKGQTATGASSIAFGDEAGPGTVVAMDGWSTHTNLADDNDYVYAFARKANGRHIIIKYTHSDESTVEHVYQFAESMFEDAPANPS